MSRCLIACLLTAVVCLSACTSSSDPGGASSPSASPSPAGVAPVAAATESIRRIATQDSANDSSSDMKLVIESPEGKRDAIDFRLRRLFASGTVSTLLEVTSPREETDKALLAVEKSQAATEATSYLAGLKKVAKLSSMNTLTLRGTKITIQELLWLELGQYDIAPGERFVEDGNAFVKYPLTAPVGRSLAFPKIVAVFREADMSPTKFELFDEANKLQKTVHVEEVKKIDGHQCLTRLAIDDHAQNRKLLLSASSVKFNTGVPARLFTESNLISIISGASQRILEGN